MADPYELPRLLSRFKLQVRRLLNQQVDLEKLTREPEYARQRLAEIEDLAEDEELLVLVLRLRDLLFPPEVQTPPAPEPLAAPLEGTSPKTGGRDYRFGARAW